MHTPLAATGRDPLRVTIDTDDSKLHNSALRGSVRSNTGDGAGTDLNPYTRLTELQSRPSTDDFKIEDPQFNPSWWQEVMVYFNLLGHANEVGFPYILAEMIIAKQLQMAAYGLFVLEILTYIFGAATGLAENQTFRQQIRQRNYHHFLGKRDKLSPNFRTLINVIGTSLAALIASPLAFADAIDNLIECITTIEQPIILMESFKYSVPAISIGLGLGVICAIGFIYFNLVLNCNNQEAGSSCCSLTRSKEPTDEKSSADTEMGPARQPSSHLRLSSAAAQ